MLIAIASGGAGHGNYAAAKALFPIPMLLTKVEGSIGPLSGSAALMQFPLYAVMIGWAVARRAIAVPALLLAVHVLAAAVCFSGALPLFS